MKILLQIPEGLKMKVIEIVDELTKEGHEVFVSGDTCYGSCDIKEEEAKTLGCEKIIHYGHTKFMDTEISVEYRPLKEKITKQISALNEINWGSNIKKIGLTSTIQFLDCLEDVKKSLKDKEVVILGQILGCEFKEADVDCYLYIGSGRFHPIGLVLKTDKPVFIYDVESGKIEDLTSLKEKFSKQRYVAQASAKDAKSFGILVSSKKGQMNIKLAEEIKEKIGTRRDCRAYIIVMDEIKPEKLLGVKVDCFINTACPRIAIDNRTEFEKPILNWDEIKEIF